jgi:hypothetical protein
VTPPVLRRTFAARISTTPETYGSASGAGPRHQTPGRAPNWLALGLSADSVGRGARSEPRRVLNAQRGR